MIIIIIPIIYIVIDPTIPIVLRADTVLSIYRLYTNTYAWADSSYVRETLKELN